MMYLRSCNICKIDFKTTSPYALVCSDICRESSKRQSRCKYKKSEKGKASKSRWAKSETRKAGHRRHMSKPSAKAKAVKRARAYLDRNPKAKEIKRIRQSTFLKTPEGKHRNRLMHAVYRHGKKYPTKGTYTLLEWESLLSKYNHRCAKCQSDQPEVDHIVPIVLGGSNTIDNIQPLCRRCNTSKHIKVEKYELSQMRE